MSKKADELEFTFHYDEATDTFDVPLQCGECYVWYDGSDGGCCPLCDSDEIVGSR